MAYPAVGTRTAYVSTESVGDVVASANYNKLPGGCAAYARIAADSTVNSGTADVTGLAVTFGCSNARFYKITISCWGVAVSVGGAVSAIEVWDDSATVSLAGVAVQTSAYGGSPNWKGSSCVAFHQPASSGAQSYAFRTNTSAGTMGLLAGASGSNNRFASIIVEDMAPNF